MPAASIDFGTITMTGAAGCTRHRLIGPDGEQVSVAGTRSIGAATMDADAGKARPVQILGVAIVEAGAAVVAGEWITTDDQGRAIEIATSEPQCGVALSAAGAAGDLIEVLLK